jgi:hypothetical protein
MNDQKPDTQRQRDVDKLVQQELSQRAQKEVDGILGEMKEGQQDAGPKATPAPESENPAEDNDYYNGMSQ